MPGWFGWSTVLVDGRSMEPTLSDGDMLLVRYGARVRPADVVLVALPGGRPLSVKRAVHRARLASCTVEGSTLAGSTVDGWWVEGDDALHSTDSRLLGAVPVDAVVARVVARYWPRPRRLS